MAISSEGAHRGRSTRHSPLPLAHVGAETILRTDPEQADDFFESMFRGGLGFAPSLIYKVTTQDAYSGVMRSWFDFLAQGRRPRPHINGALLEDLQGGMILAKLLVGYLWWLRDRYAVTTFRGRISAVLAAQRMAFHQINVTPLVWPMIRGFEAQHSPKEKGWLSKEEFCYFRRFIWRTANPDLEYRVMRWVFGMLSEAVYRIGAVLPPDASTHLDHCSFDWAYLKFVKESSRLPRHLKVGLVEKRNRRPSRFVRTMTCGAPFSSNMKEGGLFEAAWDMRKVQGFVSGRVRIRGKVVTQPHFRTWLNREFHRASLSFEIDGEEVNFTPTALRRCTVSYLYFYLGPEKAKVMIGHSSSETAKKF